MKDNFKLLKKKFKTLTKEEIKEHDGTIGDGISVITGIVSLISTIFMLSLIYSVITANFKGATISLAIIFGSFFVGVYITQKLDSKMYKKIFNEQNKTKILNKNNKLNLNKHLKKYFKQPTALKKDFLRYYVKKEYLPHFEYQNTENFFDKEHKTIIVNKYTISNIKKFTLEMSYDFYDLNHIQSVIDWYKSSLNSTEFKINYELEVKQKLEYIEKYKYILKKTDKTDEDKKILKILNMLHQYLADLAIKHVNSEIKKKHHNVVPINIHKDQLIEQEHIINE